MECEAWLPGFHAAAAQSVVIGRQRAAQRPDAQLTAFEHLGVYRVLLGPNNEGKSNILQAMVIGMQELSVAKVRGRSMAPGARIARRERAEGGYVWARDFPRHLQASDPGGKTVMHFDFRLDIFDLFNQKTWSNPVSELSNNQFGVITNANGARNMQLGLKLTF